MKALQVLSKNEDSKKLLRSLKRKNDEKDDKKPDKDDIPEKKRCTEGTSSDRHINTIKTWVLEKLSPESITNLIMTFMVNINNYIKVIYYIVISLVLNHVHHILNLNVLVLYCFFFCVINDKLSHLKSEKNDSFSNFWFLVAK